MFIYPFFISNNDWQHVHSVWYSWQALNVGMLAFSSSVIAFNISRYNAIKQRKRDFTAARAFLPESLSELTHYFEDCSEFLKYAWTESIRHEKIEFNTLPLLPSSYKSTFSSCINSAEDNVGEYLAYILTRLQILNSRLISMRKNPDDIFTDNIRSYLYSLAELQALVNKLYKFGRGEIKFDIKPLTLEQYSAAYLCLDINVEDFGDLWGHTSRIYQVRSKY